MARFATAAELAAMLQRTFSAAETTAAEWALDNATAAIKNYSRQRIEFVANDAVVLRGNWSDILWLPERPVTAVASVTVGTAAVLSTSSYTWSRHGLLHAPTGWGGPHDVVTVTYSHGFAVVPDDVKAVCLSAAARSFGNPDNLRSETIGSYAVTYNTSATGEGVLLSRSEKETLRRYRPTVEV